MGDQSTHPQPATFRLSSQPHTNTHTHNRAGNASACRTQCRLEYASGFRLVFQYFDVIAISSRATADAAAFSRIVLGVWGDVNRGRGGEQQGKGRTPAVQRTKQATTIATNQRCAWTCKDVQCSSTSPDHTSTRRISSGLKMSA